MEKYKYLAIRIIAAVGFFLALVQIIFHLVGSSFCLNQGCRLVEKMLNIPQMAINGFGALFFAAVFSLSFLAPKKKFYHRVLELLILASFVSEGILLGIQFFIAKTFCSYCLIIAGLIFLCGLLFEMRSFLMGLVFISIEMFLISSLVFPVKSDLNLNQGTYGVKTCSSPTSVAYLIFSQSCPHCKKVLNELKGCVKCEIHFNPISNIKKELLPGVIPVEDYSPEVNLVALKIFGINSVPVLIQRTKNGYKIIKGADEIISYIKANCFCGGGKPLVPDLSNDNPFLQGPDQGVCSLTQECKEDAGN